jgi:hypothetical protein
VRSSRDGINRNTQQSQYTSVPRSSSCDDHCTLVDKLIRLRLEESGVDCRVRKSEAPVCEGKVKALTTYFNSLPYLDDCKCTRVHRSTPDLRDKLSFEEIEAVQRQLQEYSEFGLKKSACRPVACDTRSSCGIAKNLERNFHKSMSDLRCCNVPRCHIVPCHKKVLYLPPPSEKHKCRSPCFNIKNPEKQKRKMEAKAAKSSSADDDNESFII